MTSLPYATMNDLPERVRSQVADLMNRRLAHAIDLETQTKQGHWNVKGPQFIQLHELFDQIHGAVGEYADLLAERVVQLGGIAHGTARVAAACSELTDYPPEISEGMDHVKALAAALSDFGARVRRAIDEADELGDAAAADICTQIARGIDKWLWFVEAHVQHRHPESGRKE